MTSEQGELDDLGHMPSISSKTREIGELQDMYRRTLAASWTCQMGELPADECIENIFAGGDGWGKYRSGASVPTPPSAKSTEESTGAESSGETRTLTGHHRGPSSSFRKQKGEKDRCHSRTNSGRDGMNGLSTNQHHEVSSDQHGPPSHTEAKRRSHGRMHEVDEFEVREDLKSWEISTLI